MCAGAGEQQPWPLGTRKLGSRTIHEPYTALLASRALITKPRPCVLVKKGNHTVELDGAASSLGPASSISPIPAGAWLSLTDAGHSSSSILMYSTYVIVSSVQSQALGHLEHGFWDAGRGSGHQLTMPNERFVDVIVRKFPGKRKQQYI